MHQPIHAIARKREMTPERVIGLGFVGVLHVVAVGAIVLGLQQHFTRPAPENPITMVPNKPDDMTKVVKPKVPVVEVDRTRVEVPPPRFLIQDDKPTITDTDTKPQPPREERVASIPDTAMVGILPTHTSPPYPLIDRRLGHEGTVTLRLTISADGTVSDAQVIKSSGYSGLDEAAVSWVVAHWRYRPATHVGAPVTSQTSAAVMFSMRNAG